MTGRMEGYFKYSYFQMSYRGIPEVIYLGTYLSDPGGEDTQMMLMPGPGMGKIDSGHTGYTVLYFLGRPSLYNALFENMIK